VSNTGEAPKRSVQQSTIQELHYIVPFVNLASIVEHGLLSHNRAARIPHVSIADAEVQGRRDDRHVPGGLALHDYVNLYFHARNAMMFRRRPARDSFAVLRVSPQVLDLPGAVITDGNAAASATRFDASPKGLAGLDADRVFAQSWDHPDPWIKQERKRQRCAEVLVPHRVGPEYLLGGYVSAEGGIIACNRLTPALTMEVNSYIYFD